MHDPLAVAFEIRRPWPQRARYRDAKPVPEGKRPKPRWALSLPFFTFAGFGWHFPGLITVWHREPGGRDSGTVCRHHHREQDANGDWQWVFHRAWRFHVHHWKIGRCGLFRAFNESLYPNAPTRLLKSLPLHSRIPAEMKPRLEELWREVREAKERSA